MEFFVENLENKEVQINKEVNYKEEQIKKLKSIKKCAFWQIFGLLLFLIPGFIAMIFLVIKLFKYNAEARKESNRKLRLIAAILEIFAFIIRSIVFIIGPILAIVWANNEMEWIKNN